METRINPQKIYEKAVVHFKKTHPEWLCTIDKGHLVIQLNWMDGTYFSGLNVTRAQKCYRHVVTVTPDGKFKAHDAEAEKELSVGLSGISVKAAAFEGYSTRSTTEIVLGKKAREKRFGVNTYSFNSDAFKKEIREYFESIGIDDGRSKTAKFFDNAYFATGGIFAGICGLFILIGVLINTIDSTRGYSCIKELMPDGTYGYTKIPYDGTGFTVGTVMIAISGGILLVTLAIVVFKYWYDHSVATKK